MSLEVCSNASKPFFEKPRKFYINTDQFQPGDLDLFVESMEIISRIERERYEERKRQKEKRRQLKKRSCGKAVSKKFQKNSKASKDVPEYITIEKSQQMPNKEYKIITTIAEVHPTKLKSISIPQMVTERCQSAEETMDEPVTHLEAKRLSHHSESDETYYSGHDSTDNSPSNSVIFRDGKSNKCASDSEESGVFPVGEPFYFQTNVSLRPRAEVISKSNNVSPRSKIIGLTVKRQCAEAEKSPSAEDLSLSEEILLAVERCERALAQIMNQKYNAITEHNLKEKHRQGFALQPDSPEEHFLDQALSLLKL